MGGANHHPERSFPLPLLAVSVPWITLLLVPTPARAMGFGSVQPETTLSTPFTVSPSPIVVERHSIDIRCRPTDTRPEKTLEWERPNQRCVCQFTIRTELRNRSVESEIALFTVPSRHARDITLGVDGRPDQKPLSETVENKLVRDLRRRNVWFDTDALIGVSVALEPGSTAVLIASGQLALFGPTSGISLSPMKVRHPASSAGTKPTPYLLTVYRDSLQPWAELPPTQLTMQYPSRWRFEADGAWRPVEEDATASTSAHKTMQTSLEPGQRTQAIGLTALGSTFYGGPFVGVGGGSRTQGSTELGRFRLRAGWEHGIEEGIFYSLSAETDFDRLLMVTPVVEAASDASLIVLPSMSLGLGVPVQLRPQTTVGIRALSTLHFLLWGASLSVDYFPAFDELRLTGLVRLGL